MLQNLHQCHSSNPSSLMPTQNQLGEPGHGASDSLPGPSSMRGTKQQNKNSKTGKYCKHILAYELCLSCGYLIASASTIFQSCQDVASK